MIFEVLGTPTPEEISKITDRKARDYVTELKPIKGINFRTRFPGSSSQGILFFQFKFVKKNHPSNLTILEQNHKFIKILKFFEITNL